MRLHRQDDDILRAGRGVVVGGLDLRNGLLPAVGGHQPNAAAAQRLQVRAACDESHILSGQRETDADIAADRADTDNCYLQLNPLPERTKLRPTRRMLPEATGGAIAPPVP